MATKSYEREFGEIQKTLEHLTQGQEAISQTSKEHRVITDERLARIEVILTEAKGGWKMLVMIGGIAATVGAIAGKVVSFFFSVPKP